MFRAEVDQLKERARRWWKNQNRFTRALPGYLARAVQNFFSYGLRQAAALSYYAIFSIFPLTLLLTLMAGRILGPSLAEEQVARGLGIFLPETTTELFREDLADVLDQGRSFTLIAVLGLIWSGLGLFSNITASLDFIFHVPSSRSLWRQRLIAVGMAIILVILVTASFLTTGIFRLLDVFALGRPSTWALIGAVFLPFGIDMVIFALLFRYVPARHVHWDAVWPAAIFGAVGWELLKVIFNWYLNSFANFQAIYGQITAAIVLLFWAYLIASIFLFSAELCAQLNEWIAEQRRYAAERYLGTKTLAPNTIEPSEQS